MHNEIMRRCYLYMVLVAVICLVTLLYTTRIVNLSNLERLNAMCASKLNINVWLEKISNKQDLTNMKLYEGEDPRQSLEFLRNYKLLQEKRNLYPFSVQRLKPKELPVSESLTGIQSRPSKSSEPDEMPNQESKGLIENKEELLDNFSVEIAVEKLENDEEKRTVISQDTSVHSDLPMSEKNLQNTPLNYRKYGEEWLMTKDELKLLRNWCVERDYRINWKRILEPCKDNTVWSPYKPHWKPSEVATAAYSYIFDTNIRPSGQYSTFFIQSVAQDGTKKTVGGDSWRVHIRGRANVPVTVMDHGNGAYEVFFLITEPGKYEAEIFLDYTLCDGMKDPPVDWFIKGNVQGKYQHPDSLPGTEHPYLLDNFPRGVNFTVDATDVSVFEEMRENGVLEKYCPNPSCMIWDGYGTWIDNIWKEHLSTRKERDSTDHRDGTLWIYGDSVGDLFYKSIAKRALCHEIFDHCNHTYNWVYALQNMNITQAKAEWDNKDFSIDRIISELDDVLSDPSMNDHSVIIINMGLHYVQGVNFSSYRKLIERVIDLLQTHNNSPHGFHGKAIWKTTTALFKERYGDPKTGARHAKGLRFLTVPRLQMFNAFATSTMCNNGIDILDVYPISDSYPEGTGGVKKPWDAVHYNAAAFRSVEDLLEEYLG